MGILPKQLKQGDTIGFVTPSSGLTSDVRKRIDGAIQTLKEWGFRAELGKCARRIMRERNLPSGSAPDRAEEIDRMFRDPKIRAIWCAQGGDTVNEVFEYLNWRSITRHPKMFIGLSDNAALLNALWRICGLTTFHGPDPKVGSLHEYFGSAYSQVAFWRVLVQGEYTIEHESEWRCVRKGRARGRLVGGNLNAFVKLVGTPYMPRLYRAILLVETFSTTIGEARTRIAQLKHAGVFERISGIVVGFCWKFDAEGQHDEKGRRVYLEEIFAEMTAEYKLPILKIREFGHRCPNTFLPIGAMAELDAGKKTFRIAERYLD